MGEKGRLCFFLLSLSLCFSTQRICVCTYACAHVGWLEHCRLWKGYRDAQASFMASADSKQMFLAIYSTRKGILEVWQLPYGKRQFAKRINTGGRQGKKWRLLSSPNMLRQVHDFSKASSARCFLLDTEGGGLYQVSPDLELPSSNGFSSVWPRWDFPRDSVFFPLRRLWFNLPLV